MPVKHKVDKNVKEFLFDHVIQCMLHDSLTDEELFQVQAKHLAVALKDYSSTNENEVKQCVDMEHLHMSKHIVIRLDLGG